MPRSIKQLFSNVWQTLGYGYLLFYLQIELAATTKHKQMTLGTFLDLDLLLNNEVPEINVTDVKTTSATLQSFNRTLNFDILAKVTFFCRFKGFSKTLWGFW